MVFLFLAASIHTNAISHLTQLGAHMKAYEVHNPSFNDMTLEQQIEAGCNDWCVEGHSGHQYFGRTAEEALAIAASYFYK